MKPRIGSSLAIPGYWFLHYLSRTGPIIIRFPEWSQCVATLRERYEARDVIL